MVRVMAIVGASAALLALGACGGGKSPGVSKQDYITRADRICRGTSAEVAPMLAKLASAAPNLTPALARKLAPDVDRLYAIGGSYVAKLSALQRPSEDKDVLSRFLDLSRQVVDAIGQARSALAGGRPVEVLGTLSSMQGAATGANAAASAYGMHDCATVLSVG